MNPSAPVEDLTVTLGVEEEFFLVDPETRDLLADPDPQIYEACKAKQGPHKVVHEFLRSQIEISTRVCASVSEVRTALVETRRLMIEGAAQYGAAVLAFLGDTMKGGRIGIADHMVQLVDDLSIDARALGCENELRHTLDIIREGAGADRQIDCFRLCLLDGATREEALRSVVDLTLAETAAGIV